jgi:excisionase family DNA binding protein
MDIDQTKQVLLKDKPFMTLPEAAKYTGVGQHKLSELSDNPNCDFIFWIGRKRMFKREKLVDYLSKAYSI